MTKKHTHMNKRQLRIREEVMLKCEVHGEEVERGRPMRGNKRSPALKFCGTLRGRDIKILLRGKGSTLKVR